MLCFVFSLGCDAVLNITKVELRLNSDADIVCSLKNV